MADLSAPAFAAALASTLLTGFVKGTVGLVMQMIMMGGLSAFLPPDLALAALIVPTFATNLCQAFRQRWQPALDTAQT